MEAARNYRLYIDTNCIQRGNAISLQEGIDRINVKPKHKMMTVTYCVPEIVRAEWVQHYVEELIKDAATLNRINALYEKYRLEGFNNLIPTEHELRSSGEVYFDSLGFSVIPTPHDEIDMAELSQRAVQKLPPFNEGEKLGDKGIKDALIAKTIEYDARKHAGSGSVCMIISNDGKFNEYMGILLPVSEVVIYKNSLSDAQSDIDLQADDLNKNLAGLAAKVFYDSESRTGLYVSEKVGELLKKYYHSKFKDARAGIGYVDSLRTQLSGIHTGELSLPTIAQANIEFGDEKVHIAQTLFMKKQRNKLVWRTTVTLKVEYRVSRMSLLTNQNYTISIRHEVDFAVTWQTNKVVELVDGALQSYVPFRESKRQVANDGTQSPYLGFTFDAQPYALPSKATLPFFNSTFIDSQTYSTGMGLSNFISPGTGLSGIRPGNVTSLGTFIDLPMPKNHFWEA